MNTIYKFVLFVLGSIALLVFIVFLAASTGNALDKVETGNTISFSGEGKITAKPDVGLVSLSILTEGATSKAAQDANSAKSRSVIDFLKKQKIDEKDIKTSSYNVSPVYAYAQFGGNPRITGYQVNQSVEVRIRDLDKVNTILDGVVSAGVNQVNQLSFIIDNPEKLRAEARKQAIEDAKTKAEELEDQLDIDLGKIINFAENDGGYPPIYYAKEAAFGRDGIGGGGPDVPTGENEIRINVTLTYQIK